MNKNINQYNNQQGFTYIDVMCGVMILLIGILALTSALTTAVVRTTESEKRLVAKQLATSTLESIFSARDLKVPGFGWAAIGNADASTGFDGLRQGIFLVGKQPIYPSGGADRIIGTRDDKCGTAGINSSTGVCLGTDETPVSGFQREIVITDICDPDRLSSGCPGAPTTANNPIKLRKVTITTDYQTGTLTRYEKEETIIGDLDNS